MTIAVALPGAARAETGYDLWLRYHKVTDSARLSEYRAAISELVMQGDSPTLRVVREELGAGLGGLLGRPLAIVSQPTSSGAVIVGTPASSRLIASLPLTAELRSVGPDGFVVRTMSVSGRRALIVAANRDVGVLYGAFHLLRLMQTNRPLARRERHECAEDTAPHAGPLGQPRPECRAWLRGPVALGLGGAA
jgi:alpha-glucuronidase